MRKMILVALAAAALAGCGGSSRPSAAQARAQALKDCQISGRRWAASYVADLPGPVSPAAVADLARSNAQVCIGDYDHKH